MIFVGLISTVQNANVETWSFWLKYEPQINSIHYSNLNSTMISIFLLNINIFSIQKSLRKIIQNVGDTHINDKYCVNICKSLHENNYPNAAECNSHQLRYQKCTRIISNFKLSRQKLHLALNQKIFTSQSSQH